MIDTISKMMGPLKSRLHQIIRLGRVKRVTIKEGHQKLQVLLGEDDVQELPRFQEFGFYSVPTPDSKCVMLFPSGNRGSGIVICTADLAQKDKLSQLAPGEVAIYNSDQSFIYLRKNSLELSYGSSKIVLGKDGKIEILSGSTELISTLKTLITQIQIASLTGSNGGGPVKFAQDFPDAKELSAFTG